MVLKIQNACNSETAPSWEDLTDPRSLASLILSRFWKSHSWASWIMRVFCRCSAWHPYVNSETCYFQPDGPTRSPHILTYGVVYFMSWRCALSRVGFLGASQIVEKGQGMFERSRVGEVQGEWGVGEAFNGGHVADTSSANRWPSTQQVRKEGVV